MHASLKTNLIHVLKHIKLICNYSLTLTKRRTPLSWLPRCTDTCQMLFDTYVLSLHMTYLQVSLRSSFLCCFLSLQSLPFPFWQNLCILSPLLNSPSLGNLWLLIFYDYFSPFRTPAAIKAADSTHLGIAYVWCDRSLIVYYTITPGKPRPASHISIVSIHPSFLAPIQL